jgi:hypothetical protein
MAEFFVSAGDEFKSPERLKEFFADPFEAFQRPQDNSPLLRGQDNSPLLRGQDNSPLLHGQDNSPLLRGQDNYPIERA